MALAGCVDGQSLPAPLERTDAGAIRDPVSGAEIDMRLGETVDLLLTSNPTTGYFWYVTRNEGGTVVSVSDTYTADPAPEGLVGSGGVQLFIFEAVAIGDGDLTLSYQRSEDDVADTIDLRITVSQ